MATFELHHLSLAPRDQESLFEKPLNLSKPDWLRKAFGSGFAFDHRGNSFHWVPYASADEIIGIVEREYPINHYEPPEDGGKPTVTEIWQGAVVTIDPEAHADGQKLAFERGTKVGQPLAVLTSMIGAVNDMPGAPYITTVKAIWDEQSFRSFANSHGNMLKSITFDFVVPNMFNLSGNLDKRLKEVGEETGAQHVTLTLESPDGVRADTPEVEQGVAYGAQGQATVTATALDGDRYSSTNRVRTSKVASLVGRGKEIVAAISDSLQEVLGRRNAGPNSSGSAGGDPDGGEPLPPERS